jgi:hypothetical protein
MSNSLIKKSHAGLLHDDLNVPRGEKIPHAKLLEALHHGDTAVRKRAQFALNFNRSSTRKAKRSSAQKVRDYLHSPKF